MTDRARIERLLGTRELAWFVDRVQTRLEAGATLEGNLTRRDATMGERAAVAALIGRRVGEGRSMSVRLDDVDRVIRSSGAASGLAEAVRILRGPIVDQRATAATDALAWEGAFGELDSLAESEPRLSQWVQAIRSRGVLRRLSKDAEAARELARDTTRVLEALPAAGESLSAFASFLLGDAHALDIGRPTATLVSGALRELEGVPSSTPLTAQVRRQLWEAVGVAPDALSSTVLVHGVHGQTSSGAGLALEELRRAGEPAVLTLRQLRRFDVIALSPSSQVYICENPAVVATAADRLGSACRPLICVGGRPSAAAMAALDVAARAGAALWYHGDFDWDGLSIAQSIIDRFGASPWRYGSADYLAAVRSDSPRLAERTLAPSWDPDLAKAMAEAGRRVEEEQVLDDLVGDLAL